MGTAFPRKTWIFLLFTLCAACGGGGAASGPAPNSSAQNPVLPQSVPATPPLLLAIAGDGQAQLRWEASPAATSYTVSRATVSTGPYTVLSSSVYGTSYINNGLVNGTRYFYRVRAINSAGASADSVATRVTPVSPPTAGSVYWPLSRNNTADADAVRFQYGARRIGSYDFHAGLDIPAPTGTPVYPVMDGTVTARVANWTPSSGGGPGNYVLVNHGQQKWTAYLHLSAVSVAVGDTVQAGITEIGKVGDTGANSSHLHLTYMVGLATEASNESRSKNPLEILPRVELSDSPPYVPSVVFRTDGSNTVDIGLPAHRMTMRWAVLKGGGQTRVLDYYEIVSQGTGGRNDQQQPAPPGLYLDAGAPPLPDPVAQQNFTLALRPNPVTDFAVDRVILYDFNGRTILDATKP